MSWWQIRRGPHPRVLPSELADLRLDLGRDLVRAGLWPMRSVGQSSQTSLLVADDPGVDRLPGDAQALGDLGDLPAVLGYRQHRLVPLLHDRQLHQHRPTP